MGKQWTRLLGGLIALTMLGTGPAVAAGADYLCDYPFEDAQVYQDYRWLPKEIPIKIYIPPVPFQTQNPGLYPAIVRQAYASWSRVAPALRFEFVDNPKQAYILVQWQEYFPEDESTWGEALLPQPMGFAGGDEVVAHRSILRLALKAQPGSGMLAGATLFSQDELLAIATHEAGHSLGLPHSRNLNDLMGPYMAKMSAHSTWAISQRDVATLYRLYGLPRKLKAHPCAG